MSRQGISFVQYLAKGITYLARSASEILRFVFALYVLYDTVLDNNLKPNCTR